MKKNREPVNGGRQVPFEWLRILAMFGVVMNHVFNYGLHIYDDFSVDASTWRGGAYWSVLELMKLMALPSVNCYILITGYFLIDRRQLRGGASFFRGLHHPHPVGRRHLAVG